MNFFKWMFNGWKKKDIMVCTVLFVCYVFFSLTAIPFFCGCVTPIWVILYKLSLVAHIIVGIIVVVIFCEKGITAFVNKVYDGKTN